MEKRHEGRETEELSQNKSIGEVYIWIFLQVPLFQIGLEKFELTLEGVPKPYFENLNNGQLISPHKGIEWRNVEKWSPL